jgi:hypothetical protein
MLPELSPDISQVGRNICGTTLIRTPLGQKNVFVLYTPRTVLGEGKELPLREVSSFQRCPTEGLFFLPVFFPFLSLSSNFSPCSQNLQRSGSSLLSTSRDYVKLQSEFTLTLCPSMTSSLIIHMT